MGRIGKIGLNLSLAGLGGVVVWLLYALLKGTVLPQIVGVTPVEAPDPLDGQIFQVDVRNGVGVSGLAKDMRHYLISKGYDVVEVGNHASFDEPETIVIDRLGNLEIAKRIATSLGLPEGRVRQDIRQDYFLDASVIIGKDYAQFQPFSDPETSKEPLPK